MENPFKQIESDATCPLRVKEAVFSEIDLIRNALTMVELYTGDLFAAVTGLLAPDADSPTS